MAEADNGLQMPAPMCLVENTQDRLIVREDTVRFLSQVKLPMVVVAIVGPYRTGKSFLMNRLMDQSSGFALGSTIESKTKGIWAWWRRHPINRDQCLLLLDTEGLGDVKKGDENNDNWIFALSVLLSSTLIYNCLSTIQQDALENLHYVTQLTDLIKVRTGQEFEDGTEFVKFFPSFVWVLRDFTLELEKDGEEITSDEYLMDALKLKRVFCRLVETYVDTIQSGDIPCMERAIDAMAKIENTKAVQAALDHYKTKMQASVQFPTNSPDELSRVHVICDREAIEIFMSMSILDEKQESQTKLQDSIEDEYRRFCDLNRRASKDKCRHILREVTAHLSKNVAEGVYNKPGGYQEYLEDREQALLQYRQASGKEIMTEDALGEFMRERNSEAETILASDKALTAAERIRAEEELSAKINVQKALVAEEERARQEKLQQDQKESNQRSFELLKKKMSDEKQNFITENEKLLEQKLQEHKRAIKDELEKVIQLREQEIRELTEQIERDRNEKSQIEQRDCSGLFDVLKVAGSFLLPRIFSFAGGIPVAVAFIVAEEAVTGLLNNT